MELLRLKNRVVPAVGKGYLRWLEKEGCEGGDGHRPHKTKHPEKIVVSDTLQQKSRILHDHLFVVKVQVNEKTGIICLFSLLMDKRDVRNLNFHLKIVCVSAYLENGKWYSNKLNGVLYY